MLDVTSHQNYCFAFAVDETPGGEGAQAKGQPASQGAVGWAVNTASTTVGFGKSLTEAAFRGVGRTTGSAVNTAGSIASRASKAVLVLCIDFIAGGHVCSEVLHCSTIHAFTKTSAVRSSVEGSRTAHAMWVRNKTQPAQSHSLAHQFVSLRCKQKLQSTHPLNVHSMCWWCVGQMVGLTKKAEELPAQMAGVTTSTGPQVTAAAHTCTTLHDRLLMPSNTMCLSFSYSLFCVICNCTDAKSLICTVTLCQLQYIVSVGSVLYCQIT